MVLACLVFVASQAKSIQISDLDLSQIHQGWGSAQKNRSVTQTPLSIAGHVFANGVGTHAISTFKIKLDGQAIRFHAVCGVDDNAKSDVASIVCRVVGDGKQLWASPRMGWKQPGVNVDVPLAGIKVLTLEVGDAGDGINYDHGDWAEAVIDYQGQAPKPFVPPLEMPVILTPPSPATPRIHGPKVFGVRPGSPFLYRVPATGRRPLRFSASNLPKGLVIDAKTGIITGALRTKGSTVIELHAVNRLGSASRTLRIECGDRIALTPQMGWNSWYVWTDRVSDTIMRSAADAMVRTGLADHGWQFVDIDDCWARVPGSKDPVLGGATRDAKGVVLPNGKFPDMRSLTDYIHSRGLRAGIYTSPGPTTCAGYEGAFQHEALDAKTFADWGFDLLKYDWCSYKAEAPGREGYVRPYRLMGGLLKQQHRDLVFNLCQYGMDKVWEWGQSVGGNSWRTADDLGAGFTLFRDSFDLYAKQKLERYAKPGGFNDPDYLLLGKIAGPSGTLRSTPFTPNEQYTQVSMWCLLAAPLILSGDIATLDPFTLSLLTNDEVIAVDQDELVRAAHRVSKVGNTEVWARKLADGSLAVGLFNLGDEAQTVDATWASLGIHGKASVRDLWRQRDLGRLNSGFRTTVARHGVALIRVRA